jgi:hypothetical protein
LFFCHSFFLLYFCLTFCLVIALNVGLNDGFVSIMTSGIPSSFTISDVDCFGNMLQGVVMIQTSEVSNPSFNKMVQAQSQGLTHKESLMQSLTLSSNDRAPATIFTTIRSSKSSRLLIQSWFLNGPQGLSSTYYNDCSWSVPVESLLTSIPLFRPIGSAVLNDKGLRFGSMTYPCSVQFSGLLLRPNASQDATVSFELGSGRGSCLTLFINEKMCCGTCHTLGFNHNIHGINGQHPNHLSCKCTFELRSSSVSKFLRLSLYGNSDGSSPSWFLNWFSVDSYSDQFQPIRDSDVLPTSTLESGITVSPGKRFLLLFLLTYQITFV